MARLWGSFLGTFLLLALSLRLRPLAQAASPLEVPDFPLQFHTELETIAHLVDRSKEYPPWRRKITIHYDFEGQYAKADITEGYEEGKTYIRRYDKKNEYMVKGGEFPECKRSYLGESMPFPEFPPASEFQGFEVVNAIECEHWIYKDGPTRVHFYVAKGTRFPVSLTDESLGEDGNYIKLMTYNFHDFKAEKQASKTFILPKPYTHKKCLRHIGGFPYLHAFHFYLRF